jgi:hypothetical protein
MALLTLLPLVGCNVLNDGGCNPPTPTVIALQPPSARQFSPSIFVTVSGENFQPSSYAVWDGVLVPTSYISSRSVIASVSLEKLQHSGAHQVQVFTPPPDENGQAFCSAGRGKISNAVTFNVLP